VARERKSGGASTRRGFTFGGIVSIVVLALLLMSGCDFVNDIFGGGQTKPVVKKGRVQRPVKVAKAKTTIQEKKPVELLGYVYTPIGKRDPFKSYFQMMLPETEKKGRPLGPLQKYEIGQLKLVAIVWGISNPRAMVETPDDKGYVIKRGTLVGKNWGKVTEIKRNKVVISEHYRAVDGRLIVNKISMRLPLDKEELHP